MRHNFKYTLKILFQNKALIFWTFAFPIILGTFFNMAFSDIEKNEKLAIIDVAVVKNEKFENDEFLKNALKILSDKKNKDQLFNIEYVNQKQAKKLLVEDKITGYLIVTNKPKIVIKSNGINETIFKYIIEEITTTKKMVNIIANNRLYKEIPTNKISNIENFYTSIYKKILSLKDESINIKDISNKNLSYTMIEFYTLIAMACLYGGIIGMTAINNNLPNMSNKGKRIAISSIPKKKLLLSTVAASYLVQLIGLILLFIYTIFILKIDYGDNIFLIILLSLVSSLAGLSLGITVSCLIKSSENTKTGIILALTMFCCFLSGMMGITMKYIIDKNIPLLNKINPASMITDGFYSLYYYDTLSRYTKNIISLLIFSIILLVIATFCLRRQKYDNI